MLNDKRKAGGLSKTIYKHDVLSIVFQRLTSNSSSSSLEPKMSAINSLKDKYFKYFSEIFLQLTQSELACVLFTYGVNTSTCNALHYIGPSPYLEIYQNFRRFFFLLYLGQFQLENLL